MHIRIAAVAAAALILVACGGGGRGPSVSTEPPLAYSASAKPHRYAPAQTYSAIVTYLFSGAEHVTIGGDLEPRENLRHILTENGIRYYIGSIRDGVGVERLENYEHDLLTQDGADPYGLEEDGFTPFIVQPRLYYDPDLSLPVNAGIKSKLLHSVRILNDALPPEFEIQVMSARAGGRASFGEIVVELLSPAGVDQYCGATAVACATASFSSDRSHIRSARLNLPDDLDTSEYHFPVSLIVHELLHALGIWGHVDSIEFPDSVLGRSGGYIPNLGYVLSKIDREILQIIYMSQLTATYNDWGEWSDVSHHLVGRSEDDALHFGVALFNGLPQPWVRGGLPESDLADNSSLSGTATWAGSLLAYSGPSPLAGDAALEVDLATAAEAGNEQALRFRDIYYLNRAEMADRSDTAHRWFPTRDIDYTVTVIGNVFANVDGDGFVTGAFLGAEHEHMGGTVKRTDLIGAFGGSRD